MTRRVRNVVVQLGGIGLAIVLLYLALRNVDFSGMWHALETAEYWWLIPLFASTVIGHFLRAVRWRMLLDALPDSESSVQRAPIGLGNAFAAVMIGYLLNMVIPRIGEVARTANLSSKTGLRFSSVFGTVVVERLLDFVTLLAILGVVAFVLAGSPAADRVLFDPLASRFESLTPGDALIAVLLLALAGGLLFWLPKMLRKREQKAGGLTARVLPVLRSFRIGLVTLFTSPHRLGITLTTVGIWLSYWLMLYLPLYMLDLIQPYNLNALSGLVLLGIGSVGFVLPAPGGIGAYHYFVIETFVQVYGVPYDVAAGFAVLTHTFQVLLTVVVGFGCLIAQGASFSSVLRAARRVEDDSQSAPIFDSRTD